MDIAVLPVGKVGRVPPSFVDAGPAIAGLCLLAGVHPRGDGQGFAPRDLDEVGEGSRLRHGGSHSEDSGSQQDAGEDVGNGYHGWITPLGRVYDATIAYFINFVKRLEQKKYR